MRPPVSRGLTKWPRKSTIMNKSNVYNCHHHQQVSFSMSSLNCWAVWIHTKSRHRVGAISIRQALLSSCWSGWFKTLNIRSHSSDQQPTRLCTSQCNDSHYFFFSATFIAPCKYELGRDRENYYAKWVSVNLCLLHDALEHFGITTCEQKVHVSVSMQ